MSGPNPTAAWSLLFQWQRRFTAASVTWQMRCKGWRFKGDRDEAVASRENVRGCWGCDRDVEEGHTGAGAADGDDDNMAADDEGGGGDIDNNAAPVQGLLLLPSTAVSVEEDGGAGSRPAQDEVLLLVEVLLPDVGFHGCC